MPAAPLALRTEFPSVFRRFKPAEAGFGVSVAQTPIDPTEFDDREGYVPDFLADFAVPLPKLTSAQRADAAKITGSQTVELKYEHFSVIQSKSRRMCFFSACNVDGKTSKKIQRSNVWRYDGRIDTKYQILQECYGNAGDGMFSRGHMTRREDPVHGSATRAKKAERDTFTVTNAIPQMQEHNSPVWLGLEDYILGNSRNDLQRVSVFTGPIFRKNDPILYGVKIPVSIFKIVAFIHDETGELAAAAYKDSQAEYLPEAESAFVFGAYKGMQVTVRAIEKATGLSFGPLAGADILAEADMSFALTVQRPEDVLLR